MIKCKFFKTDFVPENMDGVLGITSTYCKELCTSGHLDKCPCSGDILRCPLVNADNSDINTVVSKLHEDLVTNMHTEKMLKSEINKAKNRLNEIYRIVSAKPNK